MGSFLLFLLGVAAPLAVAVVVIWTEERRRSYLKMRFDRLAQDNRGLKLAMGQPTKAPPPQPELPAGSEAERKEILELANKLANGGMLLEWLRLGTRAPEEAAARLLGVNAHEAGQMQALVAEWSAPGIVAALDRLKERLAAITEMEMVWADPQDTGERDMAAMAERVMWVFEPEYVTGHGDVEVDGRLGAIARPSVAAALQGASKEGDPTLVIELKGPRVTVGGEQQLQAWNHVRDLMRAGSIRERDPVDVFVIGGAVDEYEGNPRIEGRHRNVRITSYDYGQLVARAKRLTFGLHDELKDVAPFLRQQREDIAEAQAAAAAALAAASDASSSHALVPVEAHAPHDTDDEPVRDADADGDVVRPVEYADEPGEQAVADETPVSGTLGPATGGAPRPGDTFRHKDAAQ